jgi:glutathione S-transferase
LFFEQDYLQSTIATLRHWRLTGKLTARQAEAPARERGGRHVLQVLERELTGRPYLVDDYSIADIAVFAYGHLAEDAGFDLGAFPAFGRWIQHIKKEQGPLPPVVPCSVDPDSWREL